MTRAWVDWPTRLVFESGIFRPEEAAWAGNAGFQGVLVGEGAVKDPTLARRLATTFSPRATHHPAANPSFWAKLYGRSASSSLPNLSPDAVRQIRRPLVKICGLAHYDDLVLADELGADLVGFILAPSKRRVDPGFVRLAPKTRALKVGVVQLALGEPVPDEISALVDEGLLDAVQFHGHEAPSLVDSWADRGYKAVGLAGPASWLPWVSGVAPRILADTGGGGTGRLVSNDELSALASSPFGGPRLWLAGGLGPETVAERIRLWHPELIDASSGLEESPGRKDPAKLRQYFKEIQRVIE